jgi:hypothetical protein
MSSQFPSNEQDDENEVNAILIDEDLEEESREELDKIDKIQREKDNYVKQIKSVERMNTNVMELVLMFRLSWTRSSRR